MALSFVVVNCKLLNVSYIQNIICIKLTFMGTNSDLTNGIKAENSTLYSRITVKNLING